MKNQLGIEEVENSRSKAVLFIEMIDNHARFKSLKNNDILILAATLEGLGNTLLSCSDKNDLVGKDFMDQFLQLTGVKKQDRKAFKNYKEGLTQLEKALLYFWGAASYYKYASYMKEAYICYKKIIQLMVAYLEVQIKEKEKDKKAAINPIAERLDEIRKNIFLRAIQNLYSQYENTNIVEIQRLKWIHSKEMYQPIELNRLAIFPDIEEMLLVYCQMELYCLKNKEEQPDKISSFELDKVYKSAPLSPYRLDSTVNERVVSLKFKADVNLTILDHLLNYKNSSYESDLFENLYERYLIYLGDETLEKKLGIYASFFDQEDLMPGNSHPKKREIELVEFLIIDTIFSLSKIIEVISKATHTTLFTDSYIGGVHKALFECNQLYDAIYMMYKYLNENERPIIKRRIDNFTRDRKNGSETKEERYINSLNQITNRLKEIIGKEESEGYASQFFKQTFDHIGKADIHINITNYHGEMALRKYKDVIEMHREGAAYQNMISNMYLLEDDLNNDTSQFYFAIERYYNNCGIISDTIETLKKVCRNSTLHVAEHYMYKPNQLIEN